MISPPFSQRTEKVPTCVNKQVVPNPGYLSFTAFFILCIILITLPEYKSYCDHMILLAWHRKLQKYRIV